MLKPSQQARELLSRITGKISGRIQPAAHPVTDAPPAPAQEQENRSLEDSLSIPVCRKDGDPDGTEAQKLGQFLARQERWDDLSSRIREADNGRKAAGCGLPLADLIAYGARADVVNATEHAIAEEENARSRSLIRGLMAFEALRAEHRHDPYLTALVALAHIDVAWAWRTPGPSGEQASLRRCAAHFDRAADLLKPILPDCGDSPFLKAAQCARFAGRRWDTMQVADELAALIDLAPENHRHMRTLGTYMLPQSSGSYSALELEARRTASRTEDLWGAGGYTWVYFDAITADPQACARVDTGFFLDGLQDIVRSNPSQEMINLLAAYCTVTLRKALGQDPQADVQRLEIAEASRWLIRDHLKELHPLVWAHAAESFDNSARITSLSRFAARGHSGALKAIAGQFQEEIEGGQKVAFTEKGLEFSPA